MIEVFEVHIFLFFLKKFQKCILFQLLQLLFTSIQQHHEIQNSNCPKNFLNQQRSVLGQNPPEEEVVLAKNVSLESYVKFCEAKNNLPIKTRSINGNVVAYELPLTPHGAAASEVYRSMD